MRPGAIAEGGAPSQVAPLRAEAHRSAPAGALRVSPVCEGGHEGGAHLLRPGGSAADFLRLAEGQSDSEPNGAAPVGAAPLAERELAGPSSPATIVGQICLISVVVVVNCAKLDLA